MAVIENHQIKATVNHTLRYGASDKIAEKKAEEIMRDILHEDIPGTNLAVYKTLTVSLNQTKDTAYESFKRNMDRYGRKEITDGNRRTKDGKPILAWHYIQSFEGRVDATTANEIGVKLAEKIFPGFPVQVSTHTDKENTHNHIIICAWANDGHKWHNDHKAYQTIREESDRLCDEYGLSVLDKTREQRLVSWTDAEGRKHYYEPTDRKNEMLDRRERKEIPADDVRSYRNTEQYRQGQKKEDTLMAQIKKDIDRLLPYAMDYEHLLRMLRQDGYTIWDKKKNGEWLAHVTFLPPGADPDSRGKRDNTLSKEDGYYTRENLAQIIEENVKSRTATHGEDAPIPMQDPVEMGQYKYGEIDITRLDENYRSERGGDGRITLYPRGEIERDIIGDTKQKHTEVQADLIDTSDLDRAIREAREQSRSGKRKTNESRRERLVREIQENLDSLSFVERNRVYTYSQAREIVSGLWDRRRECSLALDEARKALKGYDTMLALPKQLEIVQRRMRENAGKPEYMGGIGYKRDSQYFITIESAIQKYGLDTPEGTQRFLQLRQKRERSIDALAGQLQRVTESLAEYQKCMEVLRRIDREQGRGRRDYFYGYDRIFQPNAEKGRQIQETQKRHMPHRKDRERG